MSEHLPASQESSKEFSEASYEFTWKWELESELHCGSGLSRPGYADHLVYRNASGQPEIPGDAVKGALRMSAEQILDWLGHSQADIYQEQGTAHPQHPLLKAIFGENALVRFFPAVLEQEAQDKQEVQQPKFLVRAATALNSKTGIALENTLRQSELVSAGTVFSCRCKVWAQPEAAPEIFSLLAAALSATEQIGAKAGTGLGRVCLKTYSPDMRTWLGTEQIEQLAEKLKPETSTSSSEKAPSGAEQAGVNAAVTANLTNISTNQAHATDNNSDKTASPTKCWYRLKIHLYEPTCVSTQPTIGHQTDTGHMISAQTLKGSLKQAWTRMGFKDCQPWLDQNTRWLPALPTIKGNDNDLLEAVPLPLSYSLEKSEKGFEGAHGVHDYFNAEDEEAPDKEKNGKGIQWRGMGQGWMAYEKKESEQEESEQKNDLLQSLKITSLPTQISIHVARDYRSRSKRKSALYSRAHLMASEKNSLTLIAYAYLPNNVEFPAEIYLGKRTRSGQGRAELKAEKLEGNRTPDTILNKPDTLPGSLYVHLISPMIYRDPDTGYLKTNLTKEDWQKILGIDGLLVDDLKSRSQGRLQQNWEASWQHHRTPVTTISAGSVWKLSLTAGPSKTDLLTQLQERLQELSNQGIGEECHQGYGWCLFNPPWLGILQGKTSEKTFEAQPLPCKEENEQDHIWPGMKGLTWSEINGICKVFEEFFKDKELSSKLRGPLQTLASLARENNRSVKNVLDFCDRMADRTRPHAWENLKKGKPCRNFLDDPMPEQTTQTTSETRANVPKLKALQLAIELLLIRLGGQE